MKTFGLALILSQFAAFVWAGTLMDNFDDGDFNGWRRSKYGYQKTEWSVEKGELISFSENVCQGGNGLIIGDKTWKDYAFECEFKIEEILLPGCNWAPAVGVGIRSDDTVAFTGVDFGVFTQNAAAFEFFCERGVEGNFALLRRGNVAIKEKEWHKLRIVANGNRYEMFIDDELICNTEADLIEGGGAIIFARSGEYHFDNVVITGDNIPDKDLGLPVEPKAKFTTTWGQIKGF